MPLPGHGGLGDINDTGYPDFIAQVGALAMGSSTDAWMQRHAGLDWAAVQRRLDANPATLAVIGRMEASGGEPDGIGQDAASGELLVCDCAPESPAGRRSLCCDRRYGRVFTYHNGVQSYDAARGWRGLLRLCHRGQRRAEHGHRPGR